MEMRSRSTFFFTLLIGLPAALFLAWDGYHRASDIDILIATLSFFSFLRVMQDAVSQKSYDADMARLKREKIVRYATYGRMARVMPYIPAVFLILIFMAPMTSEDPMMSYFYLGLAVITAFQQWVVYLYGCHTMGLWKKDGSEED